MPAMSNLKPAIFAAGSLFMLAVLYLLLREEVEEENGSTSDSKDPKLLLKEVLTQLLDVERRAKKVVEALVKDLLAGKDISMAEAYQRVDACELVDPLEKQGLSIQEFEAMVAASQNDPFVMESMVRLSGQHPDDLKPGRDLEASKILEMKEFALEELEKLVTSLLKEPDASSKDFKAATVALKALVHAKVEKAHGIAADEVETAAVMKQEELLSNPKFVEILKRQQVAMQKLMSTLSSTLIEISFSLQVSPTSSRFLLQAEP
ncbi:unnamed protein product [Symbiodinium pilosum]|uniref:Uncharacterized protein n=1 Tax=Symbiodinium pilosum TaxID=2952 RepID=A0A812VWJ4_SYMPI|nr:unnamed protein product [Symbiodinium pilosum]